jgi:hypothetical protein
MTLETMGYKLQNNVYTKVIGDYTITVFLTTETNKYIRRIAKGPLLIEMTKIMGIQSLERDAKFAEIVAAQPLVVEPKVQVIEASSRIEKLEVCGLEKEIGKTPEVGRAQLNETTEVHVNG